MTDIVQNLALQNVYQHVSLLKAEETQIFFRNKIYFLAGALCPVKFTSFFSVASPEVVINQMTGTTKY